MNDCPPPKRAHSSACFDDRHDAGTRLARLLRESLKQSPDVVLALPRGGVPVASKVAEEFETELDVFVSMRLVLHDDGTERTIGAATYDGKHWTDDQRVNGSGDARGLAKQIARECEHAERRSFALRGRPGPPLVEGKRVLLVDDGFVTGSSARVALEKLREQSPRELIAATPVASESALRLLRSVADEVFCVHASAQVKCLSNFYHRLRRLEDMDVYQLLKFAS